jgi:hypothetical protein
MGGYQFEFLPKFYVMWVGQERGCAITFMPETRSNMYFWLLGDSFLRAYFTVYNVDEKLIGLLNVNTSKGPKKLQGGDN